VKAIHKILVSLAGAVIPIALGAAITFWAFGQIGEAAALRKHTFVVLSGADQLLSSLKDAETGQRGYVFSPRYRQALLILFSAVQ